MMTVSTKSEQKNIYKNLIDEACGDYQFGDLSIKQQDEAIKLLYARLADYKINNNAIKKYGPLQPAFILSQIAKVPVEVIEEICKSLDLKLPTEINIEHEDLNFEYDDFMIEENINSDFFQESVVGVEQDALILFVRRILNRLEAGEIQSLSIAAVDHDGEAQLWVPETIEDEKVEELFSPIIDAMSLSFRSEKKLN